MPDNRKCSCEGCTEKPKARFDGLWYCNKHYLRMRANGDLFLHPKPRTTRLVYNGGNQATVITASGKEIIIDSSDIEKVMKHSWCISKTGYTVANVHGHTIKLHRYLLDLEPGKYVVDHIDGDPLNNRRSNLRLCSMRENARNIGLKKTNTSGCAGVRVTGHGRYNARITVDRKEIHIGNFATMEEAVAARKQAEKQYFGEFAPIWARNIGVWQT